MKFPENNYFFSKFDKGVLNPLDGVEKIKAEALKTTGVMHQYYISVLDLLKTKIMISQK